MVGAWRREGDPGVASRVTRDLFGEESTKVLSL
jgi:hypothetical protein